MIKEKYYNHLYNKEYNYILISYIYSNINSIGETFSVIRAKQYINIIYFGCKYTNQEEIIKFCPFFIKKNINVPFWF